MVSAPMKLCAEPASRRPVCGAGRIVSCGRVTTASCAHPDQSARRGDPLDYYYDSNDPKFIDKLRDATGEIARL
jgi:hypothetical protein